MSGAYGSLESGRTIISSEVESGASTVLVTIEAEDDESPQEQAYWRQPCGLRSIPRDGKANAIISQDGDEPEILAAWDPQLSLPGIDKEHTQVHSMGDDPQLIDIGDDKIKIGKDAADTQNAARKNDHVGGGKIITQVTPVVGPPPVTNVIMQYVNADGDIKTLLNFSLTALGGVVAFPAPGPPSIIEIKEKITEGSSLTFIEGDPV